MDECIFCKIIKGTIPCYKVYEDDDTLAFLDIVPVKKGHVLVIPKEHYETLLDIPDDLLRKLVISVKKVAAGVKTDGFNLQMNNYKAAGQEVAHAHFHIVPRIEGDGLELWKGSKYDENEAEEYQRKISLLIS